MRFLSQTLPMLRARLIYSSMPKSSRLSNRKVLCFFAPIKKALYFPSTRRYPPPMSSCGQMVHKGTTIARDAVDSSEQFAFAGH